MFRFCINELLTHLHKSAVNNIVFGFTNTRGTFYKPGDTLPALRKLLQTNPEPHIELSKDTMYCFDSESYRFLAALKNGVEFSDDTKLAFAKSWDHSVAETERLLNHILSLKPHSVEQTLSLNAARSHIVQLTIPMTEIIRNVNSNIKLCSDKIEELKRTQSHDKALEDKLFVNKIDLVRHDLVQPRTVCTNSKCIQIVDFEGNKKTNYIQICHDDCQLENIDVDTVNAAGLINCAAMGNGVCRHGECAHPYQEHMHVRWYSEEVTRAVEDLNKRSELDMYKSDTEKKQDFIDNVKQLIGEYEDEHKIIEQAAKFGCFLKHNAIKPYSNATIEYLDHLIKEEKGKVQAGGDDKVLIALEHAKGSIIEENKVIESSMNSGHSMALMDPESVTKLAKNLYKLKHFGANLKNLKDYTANSAQTAKNEVIFNPPKQAKNKFLRRVKRAFK